MHSHAFFFHFDDFGSILSCAHNRRHLRLVQNVLDLLNTHGVVEANRCNFQMHRCQERSSPFPAVLGPNAKEVPLAVFTLYSGAKVHSVECFGKLLHNGVDFAEGLPLVVAKDGLSLVVSLDKLPSA